MQRSSAENTHNNRICSRGSYTRTLEHTFAFYGGERGVGVDDWSDSKIEVLLREIENARNSIHSQNSQGSDVGNE